MTQSGRVWVIYQMNSLTTDNITMANEAQQICVHEVMYWQWCISHTGSYTYKWDVLEQRLEQAVQNATDSMI